ncbi:MAG: Uma2 family endonuclease [Candidatus Sericytochromatia bacterium]|nr:Uma2 family endonuclease [Candidatus Tanganyikabacteria bacterium]
MAIDRAKKLMTYPEFAALPDDGKLYELVDGEPVVSPAPTLTHQTLLWRLISVFDAYQSAHPAAGRFVVGPYDVVLSIHHALHPDLLFFARQRERLLTDAFAGGAPDLAVEILSPSTAGRDKGRKRELYDEFGVAEYWIVHQKRPQVDVYRRGAAGRLQKAQSLGAGAAIQTPLLPGFTLALDTLFKGLPAPSKG